MSTLPKYTDASPGDRVTVADYSHAEGTFIDWGDPKCSCPDTHVSTPGMRIAYVKFDRYGESPVWENRIAKTR